MLEKILHFIKYNNATVIILAVILILGGGALAAGPEAIGQQHTSVQGVDNTALLAADLGNFNMDFKIEKIDQDEKYYYATYSFLDLAERDNAWQYQLSQRTQKISKKTKQDLGEYLVKFLAKHYEARLRELKQEKSLAETQGEQKRVEVTEYSGLVGRTLDLAAKVFPGYEPVVKRELPAPENFNLPALADNSVSAAPSSGADNLTRIYNDYVAAHPEVFNPPAVENPPSPLYQGGTEASSTPAVENPPAQEASSTPAADMAASSTPAIPEPTSVNIIELPAEPAPEPAPTSTPAPEPAPAQ